MSFRTRTPAPVIAAAPTCPITPRNWNRAPLTANMTVSTFHTDGLQTEGLYKGLKNRFNRATMSTPEAAAHKAAVKARQVDKKDANDTHTANMKGLVNSSKVSNAKDIIAQYGTKQQVASGLTAAERPLDISVPYRTSLPTSAYDASQFPAHCMCRECANDCP
jgi:hypothetical protein